MNESHFWLGFWAILGITFCVTVGQIASCSGQDDERVVQMVKAGADPVKARCSIAPGDDKVCLSAALRGQL